jgi:hypothetical protein
VAGGEDVALADGVGEEDADAVADGDEPPLQATPFSAKFVAAASDPESVPWKPKFTVPPVGTFPL